MQVFIALQADRAMLTLARRSTETFAACGSCWQESDISVGLARSNTCIGQFDLGARQRPQSLQPRLCLCGVWTVSTRRFLALNWPCSFSRSGRGACQLGNRAKEEGRLDEAVASLRKAVELKPQYIEARSNLANAWSSRGIHRGESILREILKVSRATPMPTTTWGRCCTNRAAWKTRASTTKKHCGCNPRTPRLRQIWANVFMLEERRTEALACYDRALEIQPNHVTPTESCLGLAHPGRHGPGLGGI